MSLQLIKAQKRRGKLMVPMKKVRIRGFLNTKNRAELPARFFAFYEKTSGNMESSIPLTGWNYIHPWTQHAFDRLLEASIIGHLD